MVSHIKTPAKRLTSSSSTVVYEETPRWIRGYLGGSKIVDSKRAYLIWEGANFVPYWAFPIQDVVGLVENKHVDGGKYGQRGQWFDLKTSSKVIDNVGWSIKTDTPGSIPNAKDLVALDWNKLDRWLEDEETAIGHPISPYHRVDIRASSRHVKVVLDGVTVAETNNAIFLYETGFITRYYINTIDVKRIDLFHPVSTTSVCPYKGTASYFSATVNGKEYPDLVWTYLEPNAGLEKIKGRWSFYNEKLDIYVDGEKLTYN